MHAGAARLADTLASEAARLGVGVSRLAHGARLIDAGVRVTGSIEAGRLYAECCLGGLGRVGVEAARLGRATILEARVAVDQPLVACMASQYAGWRIQVGTFFAMGSGPARSLAAAEPLFEKYPLRSRSETTVLLLETGVLPGADVAEVIDCLPSSSSKDHGRLFHDLFREYGGDFYKIDPMLFSPAQVSVLNVSTGRVFSNGSTDEVMLKKSFGIDG